MVESQLAHGARTCKQWALAKAEACVQDKHLNKQNPTKINKKIPNKQQSQNNKQPKTNQLVAKHCSAIAKHTACFKC